VSAERLKSALILSTASPTQARSGADADSDVIFVA
jgi:hypothetical protein